MITPRDRARNCAGRITAEAVCHEPFAIEQELARHLRTVPRHRAHDRSTYVAFFVHETMHALPNRSLAALLRFAPWRSLAHELQHNRGFRWQSPRVLRWQCNGARSAESL